MITMEKLGKLWRLYYRDGLTLSEVARRTGFARNTVKTWLRTAESVEPKYRQREAETKITPYAGSLLVPIPFEALKLPDELDGSQGRNRCTGGTPQTLASACAVRVPATALDQFAEREVFSYWHCWDKILAVTAGGTASKACSHYRSVFVAFHIDV
jgi:transposase-like protein